MTQRLYIEDIAQKLESRPDVYASAAADLLKIVAKDIEQAHFAYMEGYEGGKHEARDTAHANAARYTHLLKTTYCSIAHALGVPFYDHTPKEEIIEKINERIDRERGI